jgi:chromosome segregation ATPase
MDYILINKKMMNPTSETVTIGGVLVLIFGTAIGFYKIFFSNLAKENSAYRQELKDDYDFLSRKYDSIIDEMSAIRIKNGEITYQNKDLLREVNDLKGQIKNLIIVNGELKEREKQLIEERGKLKQRLDEKDQQITNLKHEIVSLTGNLSTNKILVD